MSTINNASIALFKICYKHTHTSIISHPMCFVQIRIHPYNSLITLVLIQQKRILFRRVEAPKWRDILTGSSPSRHAYIHQLTHQVHTNQKHLRGAQVTPHAYDLEVKAVGEEGMTKVWNSVPQACRMITCAIGSINFRWFWYHRNGPIQ